MNPRRGSGSGLRERLTERLFHDSRTMGPPWGPALRLLRYPVAVARDWLSGELGVRATSLAYTTLLSIVPLLAFSFSVLKGLGARSDLRLLLREFFRPTGAAADQLTDGVMQFVSNMRGDVLGSIGLAFLLYTVISTIQKVEASFNFVWGVTRPRAFGRRFTEYLGMMILGPILLAAAIGLLGTAGHGQAARWLGSVAPLAWVGSALGHALPYGLVAAVFTFMYVFMPNTRVEPRAALIGGAAAGIIWALVGRLFTAFIVYSSSLMAVYTGFAILLTTLIWVYLSWLILFIGAQLAFYVQHPQCLRHGHRSPELIGAPRERAALAVMYLLARDFAAGATVWSAADLSAALDVPGMSLAPVLADLESDGLIARTDREQFLPARAPEGILLADIVEAARKGAANDEMAVRGIPPAAAVIEAMQAAWRGRLDGRSLKDLVEAP